MKTGASDPRAFKLDHRQHGKVVEIMIYIDFFKDSKVNVYRLIKLTIITLPCCILFYLHHLKMSNNWRFYNKSRIAQIMR